MNSQSNLKAVCAQIYAVNPHVETRHDITRQWKIGNKPETGMSKRSIDQ